MVPPNAAAALQQFVDDELLRAPLLVDQVIEGAADHIRKALPAMQPRDRAVSADLLQNVLARRQGIVDAYLASLRAQVASDLRRSAAPLAAAAPPPRPALALSLVDEGEVAVDVEISHTIEAIRSVAEYELRELQTFTAALVGDMDVTRDHNPFRPEAHARALWAGAQALPMSRGFQLTFMRHAGATLAQVLRKAFAGASSRLEGAGVEPASHRTLILPAGSRRRRPGVEASFSPDLQRIRDSMPVRAAASTARPPLEQVLEQASARLRSLPAEAAPAEHARLREEQREQLMDSAESPVDQQLIELLSRLFDAMLADRALAPDIRLLLSRLQTLTLRVALRDPHTLDDETHAVWRLADRIAFYGEILPPAGAAPRDGLLRFVQGLLDQLVAEPAPEAALVQWALDRLSQHDQLRLERRCAAAAREVARLQQLEDKLVASPASASTLDGAFDLSQLDTVPSALIEIEPARRPPPATSHDWLEQRRPGDWVRMFMQGRWAHAQLLWPGERGELFLFGDSVSDTTWAVRRRALLLLHQENLLDSLEPRSLVREAAKRVMRQMMRG